MNMFGKIVIGAMMSIFAIGANATLITHNFAQMASRGGTHGESIWSTLTVGELNITGLHNGENVYAYLDRGYGGLGVCKETLSTALVDVLRPESGVNICDPGSDDNVAVGETLRFDFGPGVEVTNIIFNNNHDSGFNSSSDQIDIAGVSYDVDVDGFTTWSVDTSLSQGFDIAYNNQEFYVQHITYRTFDVASTSTPALALLGLGLVAIGFGRKRVAK